MDGKISDHAETQFGIREISSELLRSNARIFTINGKKILIRGGGWAPDMMLREDPAAHGRRVPLRAGYGSEHDPAGRQAGERRNFSTSPTAREFW